MNQTKIKIAGALFLAAFLAYGVGTGLVMSVIETPDPAGVIAAQRTTLTLGVALMVLNSLIVLGIGALLFPTLARGNRPVAWVYLITRFIEAFLLATGALGFLALLSRQTPHLLASAQSGNFFAYQTAMAVLGFGSLFFCGLLYSRRLVPRWLAAWGFLGYAVFMTGALLELTGHPFGILLSIPGGLFEVVLGVRLITKGFDPQAGAAKP